MDERDAVAECVSSAGEPCRRGRRRAWTCVSSVQESVDMQRKNGVQLSGGHVHDVDGMPLSFVERRMVVNEQHQ